LKAIGKRATGLLFVVFFLHALMLNGVVFTKAPQIPASEKTASLITFDVCGHSAPVSSIQYLELNLIMDVLPECFFPVENVFPPNPVEAVASADTGETEKPPEATL
jgi:hypothetical protein